MWFQPEPHHVPPCGHIWKIRSGLDRNLETKWAISARVNESQIVRGVLTVMIPAKMTIRYNSIHETIIRDFIFNIYLTVSLLCDY